MQASTTFTKYGIKYTISLNNSIIFNKISCVIEAEEIAHWRASIDKLILKNGHDMITINASQLYHIIVDDGNESHEIDTFYAQFPTTYDKNKSLNIIIGVSLPYIDLDASESVELKLITETIKHNIFENKSNGLEKKIIELNEEIINIIKIMDYAFSKNSSAIKNLSTI